MTTNRTPSQRPDRLTEITVDISCFGQGQTGTRQYWVRTDNLNHQPRLLLQLYDERGCAITRSVRRNDGRFDSENVMLHQSHIVQPAALAPESNTEAAQQCAAELEQGAPCQHPPHRLYCGYANNEQAQMSLWVACCDCGAVLKA